MATTLSSKTIGIVKATAPVLKERKWDITKRFYENLFAAHPSLKGVFNMSNQPRSPNEFGAQGKALGNAVYAYAANIDKLENLLPAVQLIAHKHVSFNVQAEQYPIVGENLLKSLKEVLGDAATDEILEAWGEAYNYLADIFISAEKSIYTELEQREGGYIGFREMTVARKVEECSGIMSICLKPKDGGHLPTFQSGQYLSFQVENVGDTGYPCMRNYSLSCAPGQNEYRISVKRENRNDHHGIVSNYFHDHLAVGDTLKVGPPAGTFTLDHASTKPLILVSAGSGFTPCMSMLDSIIDQKSTREVHYIYYTQSPEFHPMKDHVDQLVAAHGNIHADTIYTGSDANIDQASTPNTKVHAGKFNGDVLTSLLPSKNVDVYVVGPSGFMRSAYKALADYGIEKKNIHYEYFGPEQGLE